MICKKCEKSIIEKMIKKDKENNSTKEYLETKAIPMYGDAVIEVPYLNNGNEYWLTEHINPKFCCNCGCKINEN